MDDERVSDRGREARTTVSNGVSLKSLAQTARIDHRILYIITVLLAVSVVVGVAGAWVQTGNFSDLCRDTRIVVRSLITDQNKASLEQLKSGELRKFFPDADPGELRVAVLEGVERRRILKRTIHPEDCKRF